MHIPQSHDEAVQLAIDLKNRLSIKQVSRNFVASLSSRKLIYRSGLPALAVMQKFPDHKFAHIKGFGPDNQCSTCISSRNNPSYQTKEFIEEGSESTGGLVSYGNIYMYWALLALQEELPELVPSESDYHILLKIIQTIENVPSDTTPRFLQKSLRTIKDFHSNEEQRITLLETFGYCGILQTEEHRGSLYKYTPLGLAPRKRHSSDWCYPVDWWMGKDGVNRSAVNFWFPELESLTK
ncbi:MAG: hypothetical protein K6L75_11010 [Cellvibrionaceae bacterium]